MALSYTEAHQRRPADGGLRLSQPWAEYAREWRSNQMAIHLTDEEISELLKERKPLSEGLRTLFRTKAKRGHKEAELDTIGDHGSEFRLVVRS